MIKAEELKKWADEIIPVLTDINISIKNLRIINIERKNKLHIINHGFFRYMWAQQKFILLIQLAKLFADSSNQKKRFVKLCTRFETEKLDEEIINLLLNNNLKFTAVFRSQDDLQNAVKEIKASIQSHKESIEKVIFLRDKVHAHTDSIIFLPEVTQEELEKLVELANQVYNSLFGKIFDVHFQFERTCDWDLSYIIKKLNT